jgi:hypothetical protein
MASITTANSGSKRALFYDETKTRRTVYLGRVSDKESETIRRRIEGILSSKILGSPMAQDDAAWLAKSPALREKLIAVGLVEPEPIPEKVIIPTLDVFLDGYIKRHGKSRKPATVAVWKQVVANLKEYMPEGIRINQITAGHAKEFQSTDSLSAPTLRRVDPVGFTACLNNGCVNSLILENLVVPMDRALQGVRGQSPTVFIVVQ